MTSGLRAEILETHGGLGRREQRCGASYVRNFRGRSRLTVPLRTSISAPI